MSRARWATWSVTGASWERRGTSFPGRRPRRPSAARMRRRVDVDGREDVGGGRSVHMPVSQVASDLSGGRGIERPWDLTRHGDEELLQHLHAHAALTGIPQLLEKGVRLAVLVPSRDVVGIDKNVRVNKLAVTAHADHPGPR